MNAKTQEQPGTLSGALVTGNFNLTATMPNGKTLAISGYLYEGESVESITQRISLCQDVADFQRTKAEIPELEAVYETNLKRLDEIRAHYALLGQKKDGGSKLTSQEKQALDAMDLNVELHMKELAKGEAAIAKARATVAAGKP